MPRELGGERRRRPQQIERRAQLARVPRDRPRHHLRLHRRRPLVLVPVQVSRQPHEWRKQVPLPEIDLFHVERVVIVLRGSHDRVVVGRVGLDHHPRTRRTPTGPARYLGEELERALAAPEIGQVQHRIGLDHPDRGDLRQVESLGHHLGADDDVDLVALNPAQHMLVATLLAHRILVPAQHPGLAETCACTSSSTRWVPGPEVIEPAAAIGALPWRRFAVIAAMAHHLLAIADGTRVGYRRAGRSPDAHRPGKAPP